MISHMISLSTPSGAGNGWLDGPKLTISRQGLLRLDIGAVPPIAWRLGGQQAIAAERERTGMEVRIVEARPEHAGFLAWVMLTAHRSHLERGLWDFVVGGSEAERLRYLEALAVTEQAHWAHYSTFLIAEVEGRPVSALCGYFEAEHGTPSLRAGLMQANGMVGRSEEEHAAGWGRAGSILLVAPEHAPGVWIVEHVATLPEHRRRGLVDRLLVEILDKGRKRGASVADIGVLIGNDPAQRAYEKAGFEVSSEKRHPEFEAVYKCPGIRSLSRAL